jgi:hypothetical protein
MFITGPVEYENDSIVFYQQSALNFRLVCQYDSFNLITLFKTRNNTQDEKEMTAKLLVNKKRFQDNFAHKQQDPAIAGRSYEALLNIDIQLEGYKRGSPVVIWAEHTTQQCLAKFNYVPGASKFQPKNKKVEDILTEVKCDRNICGDSFSNKVHTSYIMVDLNSGRSEAKGFDLLSAKQQHNK